MKRNKQQLGFSMIELMVVLVIILLVAAMATPNIARAISLFKLRNSMSSIAGLLQNSRMTAVKTNRITLTRLGQQNGANVAYLDLNYNGSPDKAPCIQNPTVNCSEPLVQTAANITIDATGPSTAFPSTQLLGFNQQPSGGTFAVAFNQRGLPCTPNTTAPNATPTQCDVTGGLTGSALYTTSSIGGYLYYFKLTDSFGIHWAALTITPAGRIRVWTLNGTTWS